MIIYWFSEIKWGYLKTRKQQILSRFPISDQIIFIEPVSRITANKYSLQNHRPVYNITIPHLRSIANSLLLYLINIKFVRKIISRIATTWFLVIQFFNFNRPNIVVTSNVYWIDTIICLKNKYPDVKIIYDCNDNPLAFSTIPSSTREYFLRTISTANKIVIPHKSYTQFIPELYLNKVKIISNGVDYNVFQSKKKFLNLFEQISDPILMYVGAISDWFDYNLVKAISKELNDVQIFLLGPVGKSSILKVHELILEKNISHIPSVPHNKIIDYLHYANVCIIPFLKSELTSTILPNKIFEYSAAGKPCVMTKFNNYLDEFEKYLFISNNIGEFISNIKNNIESPPKKSQLKEFASQYDWKDISKTYHAYLLNIIDE